MSFFQSGTYTTVGISTRGLASIVSPLKPLGDTPTALLHPGVSGDLQIRRFYAERRAPLGRLMDGIAVYCVYIYMHIYCVYIFILISQLFSFPMNKLNCFQKLVSELPNRYYKYIAILIKIRLFEHGLISSSKAILKLCKRLFDQFSTRL